MIHIEKGQRWIDKQGVAYTVLVVFEKSPRGDYEALVREMLHPDMKPIRVDAEQFMRAHKLVSVEDRDGNTVPIEEIRETKSFTVGSCVRLKCGGR